MKRRVPRMMVIVLVTVALLALFILTALPGATRSRIGDFFGRVFDPLNSAFQKAVEGVSGFFTAVSDNKKLKVRVGELEEELGKLNREMIKNREKVKAYEELKDALNLVTRFDDSKVLGSVILNKELGSYHDLIRIRAGRKQGLNAGGNISYPVVDQHSSLVGRVHSSETFSSKVMPLLHEAFSVSARVEGSYRSTFRVRGDILLREQGLCLGDSIPEGLPIKVGDLIVTSGEGGIFPGGVPIGEVVSLHASEDGKVVTCAIKPACDFDSLKHVFVILEQDDES